MRLITLTNLRLGLATNSSSSHALISVSFFDVASGTPHHFEDGDLQMWLDPEHKLAALLLWAAAQRPLRPADIIQALQPGLPDLNWPLVTQALRDLSDVDDHPKGGSGQAYVISDDLIEDWLASGGHLTELVQQLTAHFQPGEPLRGYETAVLMDRDYGDGVFVPNDFEP